MSNENQLTPLAARRQLSFLSTFDKKFQGFRREMERLRRASSTGKAFGGRWPTEGLERTARSLVGAGAVYGLPQITDWARVFLGRLDTIRTSQEPPAMADLDWLASGIGDLQELQRAASEAAEAVLDPDRPRGSDPGVSPLPHGARDSKPFIASARTTDPPPPDPRQHLSPQPAIAAQAPPAPPAAVPAPPAPARDPEEEFPRDTVLPSVGRLTLHELPAAKATSTEALRSLVLLAVRDSTTTGKLQFTLKSAGFEVKKAASLERISQEAVEEAPELIVVDMDEEAPGGATAIGALAADPLTDYIPVLRVGTVTGPARTNIVPKPINGERLVAEARRLASPDLHSARVTIGLKDPNLDELVNFVCEELRSGVLDSATGTHASARFRLLFEAKLMASVWGLVAQVRKAASVGSRGRIRFLPATSGQMGMMALAEADEVLDATGQTEVDEAGIASLRGIRVLVADDDPGIRVVFDRVLGSAGISVITAGDGIEALESIRQIRPDLVITDILMPGMDGWELCNRIRQDYHLRHIPVIMLSWKEDFLERMRGLNVNADGFMLKEVDRDQILGRAARVLKPRFVLQSQLRIEGDVSGRIERVGVMTVLETAVATRPDCRVTFRESWNYFEADIRDGQLAAVTRTGSDGSFASGPPALERLLGVTSGRFAVVEAKDTARRQFREGTAAAIENACRRLNNMVAQITDGAMLDIARVELDEEVVGLYKQIMPPKLRGALDRLVAGESPREIILAHDTSPDGVETLLLDLLRAGAIRTIAAPPPDLARAPVSRDSARWRAIGDGTPFFAEDEPPRPPIPARAIPATASIIPLPDEDLEEVPQPEAGVRMPAYPSRLESPRGLVSRGWQIFTLVALVALGLSVYFNVRLWEDRDTGPAAVEPARVAPSAIEPAPVPEPIVAAPEPEPEPEPEPAVAAPEPEPEPEPAVAAQAARDMEDAEEEARSARRRKRRLAAEEEAKAAAAAGIEKKPAAAPESNPYSRPEKAASGSGSLVVSPPADAPGPVMVSVDGKPRGNAPVTISLSPGLHEVTFSADGRRTLRMVSIKAGDTKRITAKIPE